MSAADRVPDAEYRRALTQAFREGFSGEAAYEQAAAIVILRRAGEAERYRYPCPVCGSTGAHYAGCSALD